MRRLRYVAPGCFVVNGRTNGCVAVSHPRRASGTGLRVGGEDVIERDHCVQFATTWRLASYHGTLVTSRTGGVAAFSVSGRASLLASAEIGN
jgi:hypothetical protein